MTPFYVGHTHDLVKRVLKHNDGHASAFTARRRPVVLVYSETHIDALSAIRRERQLKGWTRREKEALAGAVCRAPPGGRL
jgi:predicted GIY-YIG superfamily endonuclease